MLLACSLCVCWALFSDLTLQVCLALSCTAVLALKWYLNVWKNSCLSNNVHLIGNVKM